MQTITTIGFDIAKSVFQVCRELMPLARWSSFKNDDVLPTATIRLTRPRLGKISRIFRFAFAHRLMKVSIS